MKTRKLLAILIAAVMVFALLPASVFAAGPKNITTSAELAQAIKNQVDGETWILAPHTTFDLTSVLVDSYSEIGIHKGGFNGISFIFPITASNLTIKGGAGTVITSSKTIDAAVGGNWNWQNFITIAGDNVTLDGLTLIPNINHYEDGNNGVNKVIEVIGKNSTIKNLTVEPNPSGITKDWSGSIYYSNGTGSSDTLENVYLSKGRVSLGGKTGGTLAMTNVTIDFVNALLVEPNFIGFQPNSGVTYNIVNSTLLMNQHRIDLFNAATNHPTDLTLKAADQGSEVTANADVTYTVVIPASVNFGTINKSMSQQSRDFIVSVQNAFIKAGATIKVANTTTSMVMKDNNGTGTVELPFQLTPPTATGFVFSGNGSITGHVTCNPSTDLTAPGSYKGFMTFSVTYTE